MPEALKSALRTWAVEFRCWFFFRQSMKLLGPLSIGKIATVDYPAHMYQCEICAKTISVSQKDLSWI
jgi:hypothetical protein